MPTCFTGENMRASLAWVGGCTSVPGAIAPTLDPVKGARPWTE